MLPGQAQQPLRGKVIAARDQSALPGATVIIRGTSQGTTTDASGLFTLPAVPDTATLLVRFLGYQAQTVPLRLPLAQPLVIALTESESQLREVEVSTGYQTLPQERATGSFAQLTKAELSEQVSTDVLSRLESVASGLTVDRSTSQSGGRLLIRGLSTIQGPKSPLIVVDNFPYEGDITNINPNDVESVTILKDAAAASIWGARAGNGVVVITTKKGRFNQPFRMELNSNVTVSEQPDLSYIRQMASSDYIDVEQLLFSKGYYNSKINSSSRPALSPVVELLRQQALGTVSEDEVAAQLSAWRGVDVRDEFTRHMYQSAVNQQYSLSLQGSSEVNAWLVSAGYDHNTSELDAGYERLNLRLQHTLRPVKNLEFSTDLYYTRSQRNSGKPGYGQISTTSGSLYPYARFADEAGNALPIAKDFRQSYITTAGAGKLLDWQYYPLEDYRHARSTADLQDVLGNLGLSYRLPGGLAATLRYQYQRQQTTGESLLDAQSYAARNLVNLYTQLDPQTGEVTYAIPKGGILDLSTDLVQAHSARGQLSFDRDWAHHRLSVLAGVELRHAAATGNANRLYGYDPSVLTFGYVDYTQAYLTFINGRQAPIPAGTNLYDRTTRFASLFANTAYTYRGRYTLSASARRDGSNLFGVQARERWNPLWSAGLAWDLAAEPFYGLDFLPYLKLRATYGYSGNVDPGRAAVTTMAYLMPSPYTLDTYAVFSSYANPALTWERAGMLNLGLDFRLRGEVLSGSLEYFRKKGTDLFGQELLDYTAGAGTSIVKNVASMQGRGVDLTLSSRNVRTPSFGWTTDLKASYYRDEVTEYFQGNQMASRFVTSVPAISAAPGRPVYGIYSYRWAGLDPQTGNPQGYVEGQVSQDYTALSGFQVQLSDLKYHGSALPTFYGSLGNTLSYKGFSLTARLTYKLGYYFRRSSLSYSNLFASGLGHADYAERWQQPGDEAHTDVPSLVYPAVSRRDSFYAGSEALVERGDHVRLQYITASYTLDRSRYKRLPFQRLQLQLNASNLGLLWRANKHGLDPDYALGYYALAPARSYAVGLKASF